VSYILNDTPLLIDPSRFLLARLYADSLLDKKTKRKVLSAIENLGSGLTALDEAYKEATDRINGQLEGDRQIATSVLSWITCAKRQLTIDELCHALAVEVDDQQLDEDNIPNIEDVVSVCAGLIEVDDESRIIRLVHYTTQQYFERKLLDWNHNAQQDIALTCLTYLSLSTFQSGSCSSDSEFEERIDKNKFLGYVAQYWGNHICPVQESTPVSQLALTFLQNDELLSSSTQVLSAGDYRYEGYSKIFPHYTTGLHLCARFGLCHLLIMIFEVDYKSSSSRTNLKDSYDQTPLSLAAENGHEAIVKLLLERPDIEVNSKDGDRTPLSLAAENRHEAIVKLLLERPDIEVNSKDPYGRTPLLYAVRNGHEAIVKLLLERPDIEVNSKDPYGWTPLLYAAKNGHEAIVKLLLERPDIEVNSKDGDWTPLLYAAENGHEAIVKLLLERPDIEVNSKDPYGWTPLLYAVRNGHEAIVKLLLERPDIEVNSKDGWTPLLLAARNGHEAIVKLLLERPDVEVNSKDGWTTLWLAARNGHEAIVKLLLERPDVEVNSKDGWTTLLLAARNGHEAIVKLLLERPDVEVNSKDGWTPLWLAARNGHEAIVKLLSEERKQ
jgi:ankyrin repeat protein